MQRKRISFLLIAAYLIFTSACTTVPVNNKTSLVGMSLLKREFPKSVYPENFTLNQRIILTIDEKEYDFIGYLIVDRKSGFRAMAFGEMGGKVFDLAFANGTGEILKTPENMPIRPVMEGVIGDIRHIYMLPFVGEAFQIKDEEKREFSIIVRGQTEGTKFDFSNDKILHKSTDMSKDTVIREASHFDYKIFPGWGRAIPSQIKVVNHRWHYSMEITLIKITEGIKKETSPPSVGGD